MNQPWLIIASIETLLVVIVVLLLLLGKNWRAKRRRHQEFESLLDDIKDRHEIRPEQLARLFNQKYRLEKPNAQALAENLILAERQFLYQFVEQQLQQQAVTGFYENLCTLLDSYLNALPHPQQATNPAKPESLPTAEPETTDAAPEPTDEKPAEYGPPPPDWGDVFD